MCAENEVCLLKNTNNGVGVGLAFLFLLSMQMPNKRNNMQIFRLDIYNWVSIREYFYFAQFYLFVSIHQ